MQPDNKMYLDNIFCSQTAKLANETSYPTWWSILPHYRLLSFASISLFILNRVSGIRILNCQ